MLYMKLHIFRTVNNALQIEHIQKQTQALQSAKRICRQQLVKTNMQNIENLFQYGKIFEAIIELQQKLQNSSVQNGQSCVNDVFSVVQKAYWKLYLQENEQNLTEQQKKETRFYLTSKIGKQLDSQLSKTKLENDKMPKWFMYKNHIKQQDDQEDCQGINGSSEGGNGSSEGRNRPRSLNHHNFRQQSSSMNLKLQERQGTFVDPYHASIKLQAQYGMSQIQVIYKFFNIKAMLQSSRNMLDIEKITIIYRKGNTFDRDSPQEVEQQKQKFKKKFKLYTELIYCYQHFGYGARKAKKHCKQKLTGIIYQYAVVHIAKILFKLVEKYVMNFINRKAKYTHRARLEKIAYNVFNLPDFFPPQLKVVFIKMLKIVFLIQQPLPLVNKREISGIYEHIVSKIEQKEKNPQNFKNQYMLKLENPTFYNVKKELREKVKEEAQQRKRLGIKNKGRKSKATVELNLIKQSLVEERMFFQERKKLFKSQLSHKQLSIKSEELLKKQYKKLKKEVESQQDHLSEDQYGQYSNDHDQKIEDQSYFDSDQESQDIKDYFKKSTPASKSKTREKKHKVKEQKHKSKEKRHKSKEKKNKSKEKSRQKKNKLKKQ